MAGNGKADKQKSHADPWASAGPADTFTVNHAL